MERWMSIVGVVVGVAVMQCAAAQTVHVVGDSMGWSIPTSGGAGAYATWATNNNFVVGDVLIFNFTTDEHDVLQVPKASFDACTPSNPIGTLITTGPANVTLTSTGDQYYICTLGRHCLAGQKLAITVSATPGGLMPPSGSPNPTPPTSPTPPATPSPASTIPADCAPTPTLGPTASRPSGPGISPGPSAPGSSSTTVLASMLVSMLAVVLAMLF